MSLCQSVMNVEGISKWANDCPIMVYGRPGKCLDSNPNGTAALGVEASPVRDRVNKHEMVSKGVGPRCRSSMPL
jgi:hypothetical protein